MSLLDPCLIRSRGPSGQVVVRLGMPLIDDYLEFMEGRCRPNTVLAAAYDLRVFFGVVGKSAGEVEPADVLGFITAQRTGRSNGAGLRPVDDETGGVATSTVARRLSILRGDGRGTAAETVGVAVAIRLAGPPGTAESSADPSTRTGRTFRSLRRGHGARHGWWP